MKKRRIRLCSAESLKTSENRPMGGRDDDDKVFRLAEFSLTPRGLSRVYLTYGPWSVCDGRG